VSKPIEVLRELSARARAIRLPADFTIGAATAAYQIEGAVAEDGRGESVWDRFTHTPGTIADGQTGDIACDHYHRWREDLALMKQLNLNAYRFSIAWPRIIPEGRGKANEAGLAFYDRLVDGLLEAGIAPFVTLYHWDLPQTLQDEGGGWLRRGVVDDYLAFGEDAPGLKLGAKGALAAGHHALLAHGEAVPLIRANVPGAKVGIVLDLNASTPASGRPEDIAATRRFDGCQNRWYLDALFRGAYPTDMLEVYAGLTPDIRGGDMAAIAAPIDYLGVNVYRRSVIADGADVPPVNFTRIKPPGVYTTMGWEVYPPALYDILAYVQDNYAPGDLYITENGAAFEDEVPAAGSIVDLDRARYMIAHLEQAARAIQAGIPLKGYFAWTLMDNFEWACGFSQRFGLIHVDYDTQQRRFKASGAFYRAIAGKVDRNLRRAG
jgi:beta-glucosidase